jgi:hypothetical protein
VERVAAAHWTEHEQRLTLLVARARAGLPVNGFRKASRAIGRACDRLEKDELFRRRLGTMLLADALDALPVDRLLAAA